MRTCTQAQQSWTNDNKGYSETECKKVSQKSDMTVEVIDDLDSSDADDTSSVSANDTRQVWPCLTQLFTWYSLHITPILQSLHWLPIRMRVIFKICTYIFKIMRGLAPDHLNYVVVCYTPTRVL